MLAPRLQPPSDNQPITLHTQSHVVALLLILQPSEIITNNNIDFLIMVDTSLRLLLLSTNQ
jgi:hypothetical protein